ncbi:MAG TPA: energy transducer TonB [Mucilaginibacter sp.]|nr:energy transducer TonB [Mucilaginibacter sp.]
MKPILITIAIIGSFAFAKAQQADTIKKVALDSVSSVFTAVEQEPTYPGGLKKWFNYIKTNLQYPEKAKESQVEGKVFISFIVEKDGTVTFPKVVRGIGNGCDEEAVRLLKNSPKWNPGMQNGHVVRVSYMTIVDFKL